MKKTITKLSRKKARPKEAYGKRKRVPYAEIDRIFGCHLGDVDETIFQRVDAARIAAGKSWEYWLDSDPRCPRSEPIPQQNVAFRVQEKWRVTQLKRDFCNYTFEAFEAWHLQALAEWGHPLPEGHATNYTNVVAHDGINSYQQLFVHDRAGRLIAASMIYPPNSGEHFHLPTNP